MRQISENSERRKTYKDFTLTFVDELLDSSLTDESVYLATSCGKLKL